MDAEIRRLVRARAAERCEYCHMPQASAPLLSFHVEHIEARQHVLDDSLDNLALACRHKGPNLSTLDFRTRQLVRLFHPRHDIWEEHFEFRGALLVGLTDVGAATVRLLQMNTDDRAEIRAELMAAGEM